MSIEEEIAAVYRRHASDLRKIVMQALRDEVGLDEVRRRIGEYFRDNDIQEDLQERLLEESEAQFTWIDRRTMSPRDRRELQTVLATSGQGFARMQGEVSQKLLREVIRALQDNAPQREIEGRIASAIDVGRHRAFTVGNTATSGLNRAGFWRGQPETDDGEAGYSR